MGKIIAVFGSPSSGKTAFSLKLSQELYKESKGKVIFVSPDTRVPSISYIFPNKKREDLYSLSKLLDKTDISQENILKQLVSVKSMPDFGYLGFITRENGYSFPRPTKDKLEELTKGLRELADYVVFDCSTYEDDIISDYAASNSDKLVRLINADIKSIEYFASQAFRFQAVEKKVMTVISTTENDVFLPIDETKAHFNDVAFVLPYSIRLKEQGIKGTLSEPLSDKKYCNQIAKIARLVV